jgi:spore cortex biosynthesis protein YabQ
VSLETQWLTMGWMTVSGIILGVLLDIYRVMKGRFRFRGWVVSLIDLLYWTVAAGLVFGLLMWSNWGVLRFYVFLAVVLGIVLYYSWMSRTMIRLISWSFRLVEWMIRVVFRTLYVTFWVPLTYVWTALGFMGGWVIRLLLFLLRVIRRITMADIWLIRPWARYVQPRINPRLNWVRSAWHRITRLFSRNSEKRG